MFLGPPPGLMALLHPMWGWGVLPGRRPGEGRSAEPPSLVCPSQVSPEPPRVTLVLPGVAVVPVFAVRPGSGGLVSRATEQGLQTGGCRAFPTRDRGTEVSLGLGHSELGWGGGHSVERFPLGHRLEGLLEGLGGG